MARKRFIKPEFFNDVDLAEVAIEARYLYAGLWPFMDRQGIIEADARIHRANVFPHDEKVTVAMVQTWLDQLVANGFVVRFAWQGKTLLYCPTFATHQRLFPDEKARFAVTDDFLASLSLDAGVPAQSSHSTVTVPSQYSDGTVQLHVEEKEKDLSKRDLASQSVNSAANFEARMSFDLPALFDQYPKQERRSVALAILGEKIRTQADYDAWQLAIRNYANRCRREATELKYIKSFKNFAGEWKDWRDYTHKNAPLAGAPGSIRYEPADAIIKAREEALSAIPDDPNERRRKLDEVKQLMARTGLVRKEVG